MLLGSRPINLVNAMWCCVAHAGSYWGPRWPDAHAWPDYDDGWPHDVWPELLCCAVLAYPSAAKYVVAPMLVLVYMLCAYTLYRHVRSAYRCLRVQDRKTRISRGIKHATRQLLVRDGTPIRELNGFRDGFTATLWREHFDAMQLRERVRDATKRAISALAAGQTSLAWAPYCAVTGNVPAIVLRVAILASGAIAFTTHSSAATAAIALAVVFRAWQLAAVPIIALGQRMFSVSAGFQSVRVVNITCHHEENDVVRMTVMLDIVPRAS